MEMAPTSVNSSRSKGPSNLQFKQDNRPAIEEVRSTVLLGVLWWNTFPVRGVGLLNKISYGGLRPLSYNSVHHFWWKRYPFLTPFIDKWYPFHIPSLELCIPFKCAVNHSPCTVFFKNLIKSLIFLRKSAIMCLLALLGPLTDRSGRFPSPLTYILGDPGADSGGKGKTKRAEKNAPGSPRMFVILQPVKSQPFKNLKPGKGRIPFGWSLSCIGHGEYTPEVTFYTNVV